jgi:hypothetical protein
MAFVLDFGDAGDPEKPYNAVEEMTEIELESKIGRLIDNDLMATCTALGTKFKDPSGKIVYRKGAEANGPWS